MNGNAMSDTSDERTDRDIGMDVPITRKDFIGSTLLGVGAALLGAASRTAFVLPFDVA